MVVFKYWRFLICFFILCAQVTVHPTVCYYSCQDCNEPVTESLIFISDDRLHDHHAVRAFTNEAIRHLQEVRHLQLGHIIQFTDGCSAQYKSKGPFLDISNGCRDFGCLFERNFFGSRHGKGPSDGESAVVKSSATRAIKAGTAVISSSEELFAYCVGSSLNKQPEGPGCNHSLRSFFYVTDINRIADSVATLAGTRSLHAVKSVAPNVLLTRTLSCACQPCRAGQEHCEHMQIAGPWTRKVLKSAQVALPPAPDQPLAAPAALDQPLAAPPALDQPLAANPTPDQPLAATPTPDQPLAATPTPDQLVVGDFCVVAVRGRHRTVHFYAKVVEIIDDELKVHYLDKAKGNEKDVYIWSDSAWVPFTDVLYKVPTPSLVPGRGIAFSFN
jgi:hypothetical protein